MATTLSLVVIFVPSVHDRPDRPLLPNFGITSATAIMLSMFVSFRGAGAVRVVAAEAQRPATREQIASPPGWIASRRDAQWSLATAN